jgi:hypothetical protein
MAAYAAQANAKSQCRAAQRPCSRSLPLRKKQKVFNHPEKVLVKNLKQSEF